MSFATSLPLLTSLAFLLGLSLFFGLAFEEFYAHQGRNQPGGVRTFPLLALAGAMLYLLDATHLIPVSVGVLVLGAWLHVYYRSAVAERDAEGVPNVGLTVPVCNLLAYLLGPIALTQPHWVVSAHPGDNRGFQLEPRSEANSKLACAIASGVRARGPA